MNIPNDAGSNKQDVNKYSKCCPDKAHTFGHQDTLRQMLLHAWNRCQWYPFSRTHVSFGPSPTAQVRPCHHNRHTMKGIYSPRCFKKIKNETPPSSSLWLVSWATSLHIWAAWGPWHHLHPTQICLTPIICRGAASRELLVNMLRGWHWQPSCIGTSNKNRPVIWVILYTLLSASRHILQTGVEGDRIATVRLNFSWEAATPKPRCLESLWLLRWLNY